MKNFTKFPDGMSPKPPPGPSTAAQTLYEVLRRSTRHPVRSVAASCIPTVITRNGAPVAAVVPIADFEALEEAADVMLAREAEAVLAKGGPTMTMAELLADLFTEHDDEAT